MCGTRFITLLTLACGLLSLAAGQSSDRSTPPTSSSEASSAQDSTKLEIVKAEKAIYPMIAGEKGIQGVVWVMAHVSETGDVESVDLISGEPELADAALRAAKKWKFKPFIKNGKPIKVETKLPFQFAFADKIRDNKKAIAQIHSENAPAKSEPSADSQAASEKEDGTADPDKPKRVRVSQGVSEGLLLRQVVPIYPPEARRRGIQGTVVLRALIGEDGRIRNLQFVSGPKELEQAATGAVEQWVYKPYYLFGKPVEVDTQITVNFKLSR